VVVADPVYGEQDGGTLPRRNVSECNISARVMVRSRAGTKFPGCLLRAGNGEQRKS